MAANKLSVPFVSQVIRWRGTTQMRRKKKMSVNCIIPMTERKEIIKICVNWTHNIIRIRWRNVSPKSIAHAREHALHE